MSDLILSEEKLSALNFALHVGLAYTQEQMQSGELNTESQADFEYCEALLTELLEFFAALDDEKGEMVH